MIEMINHKTVTVKLTRGELCRLLIATTSLSREGESWKQLHDKLRNQLDAFDTKLEEKKMAKRIMTPRPPMLAGTMLTGQQWEAIINQIEYEMSNGKLEPMLDVAKDQTRTLHQLGLIGPREFNLLFSWIFDLATELRSTEGRTDE